MSNEVYDFNIGHSTAYAYAKASGDLPDGMTPEEYGELLASYATVGQTAVTAAQTATTKASEAATSATTATNKATEATTAATTATTKAGEASTSANTATSAKDTAVSASQTATTKATEATTAAATATSAKTDAVAANTAAQSAKTAAQTAQTGAETAAASVSASAEQIATNTDDIAQLMSDLSDVAEIGIDAVLASNLDFEQGGLSPSDSGAEISNSKRIRSEKVKALSGSTLRINSSYKFMVYWWSLDDVYSGYNAAWVTSYTVPSDCLVRVVVANSNDNADIIPSDISNADFGGILITHDFDKVEDTVDENRTLLTATENLSSMFADGFYVKANGTPGTIIDRSIVLSANRSCLVYDCKKGDVFIITAYGGTAPRAYCFVDTDDVIIAQANADAALSGFNYTAPSDGTLIVNAETSFDHTVYLARKSQSAFPKYKMSLSQYNLGSINNNKAVGDTLTNVVNTNNSNRGYLYFQVKQGDGFTFNGKSYSSVDSRLFCFTDSNHVVLRVAAANRFYTNYTAVAPADGYVAINVTLSDNTIIDVESNWDASEMAQALLDVKTELNKPSAIKLPPMPMPKERAYFAEVANDVRSAMTLTDYYAAFDALATDYSNYVSKSFLGQDQSETYNIYKYVFTPSLPTTMGAPASAHGTVYQASDFPTLIIGCNIHGFEKPICFALLNTLTRLCESVSKDDIFGWIRNNVRLVVIPSVNPWGYVNDKRGNSRGVDINRNFPAFWEKGSSDPSSIDYRGASALSEAETVIYKGVIDDYAERAICLIDLHTVGVFTSYENMTSFVYNNVNADKMQMAGYETVRNVTYSGWEHHDLPTDSGFIGALEPDNRFLAGKVPIYASTIGLTGVTAEGFYRYYDPDHSGDTAVYNTNTNCLNAEYLAEVLKNIVYQLT